MRTQSNSTVLLALAVGLGLAGCKKEPTTDPGSATPATSEDDDGASSDDSDDSDEASDEGEAPLGKANFDETVFEHFSEVSDCYVAALEGNPELAGKLEADFTIGADGSLVELVAVEGSTLAADEAMLACIKSAASGWSFAKPADGDMTLRYTFDLQPG